MFVPLLYIPVLLCIFMMLLFYINSLSQATVKEPTIFILINAPGALQFRSLKNDLLETKCGQIYKNFNVLKPFYM